MSQAVPSCKVETTCTGDFVSHLKTPYLADIALLAIVQCKILTLQNVQ